MPASCAATEITKTGVVSSTEKPTSTRSPPMSSAIAGSRCLALSPSQQLGTGVLARRGGGKGLDRRPGVLVQPLRNGDLHGDEQVAGLLPAVDATALDPQRAPAGGSGGHAHP